MRGSLGSRAKASTRNPGLDPSRIRLAVSRCAHLWRNRMPCRPLSPQIKIQGPEREKCLTVRSSAGDRDVCRCVGTRNAPPMKGARLCPRRLLLSRPGQGRGGPPRCARCSCASYRTEDRRTSRLAVIVKDIGRRLPENVMASMPLLVARSLGQ